MGQARRRAAGEERVRGVPPARRRRQPKRVRHELGAVVERQARGDVAAARRGFKALLESRQSILEMTMRVGDDESPNW